ncbi:TonB family protein [Natronogracilivirga saccharolytica]|uniref:TonB family protein n=1 Tax=Natronogracilivirga saccharolytica TaxID=2812953 RepID=A0A8J7RSP4_9BACT|nr:TonB family protein [Natronogracilivirga saccharolytica]MBP3193064.1 TonB family protein [Natronogracilivirga saccharolytica]
MNIQSVIIKIFLPIALSVSNTLLGCTAKREAMEPTQVTELPAFKSEEDKDYLELIVMFHLEEDGTIKDLQMVDSSGDVRWDSAAADSMKSWRFPSPSDSESKIFTRTVKVDIIPAEILNIAELLFQNKSDADLIYSRLRAGKSFESFVKETQEGETIAIEGRLIEGVESTEYPAQVAKILVNLQEGQYSSPVELGGKYAIFKRYGDDLQDQ